ncbi:MAG: DUF3854 domain-containing protein [Chloroflexota bacterium]
MNQVFSEEVPDLLQAHLEHLLGSAIDPEVIRERGYLSVLGKKALQDKGFSPAQQRAPGIFIPLWGVEGEVVGHQLRPDQPREREGRAVKYETPRGAANRLDVPPRCLQGLGNPSVPLWLTEGAKKADALASRGACALNIGGVWSWRGKNQWGGLTILSDWDRIALNGRTAYLCFDSDVVDKPPVRQALRRLSEHLERKGARVHVVRLPQEGKGKTGIDDYLAAGHSLEEAIGLAETLSAFAEAEAQGEEVRASHNGYAEREGCLCWLKKDQHGVVAVPLGNFTARAVEDVVRDNGLEQVRAFVMEGRLSSGKGLPRVEVPASSFPSLNWVTEKWGMEAVIAAGTSARDRLREAIQLSSQAQGIKRRVVFTHTGWRSVDGRQVFLTASGALGAQGPQGVEVELEEGLERYSLPLEPQEVKEAMMASLDFLRVAPLPVTLPLWGAMYLAPLCPLVDPAFTLWLIGPTGSLKSTLSALALSHYGRFTEKTLPAAWKDTANYLEKRLFLAKDLPLVIDDFCPGGGRDQEIKAELVDRAQGNRAGRGRLRSDTSTRHRYIPRGVALATGEELPSGQSHLARTFMVEIDRSMVNLPQLTRCQKEAVRYPHAMAGYIRWLAEGWERWQGELPRAWETLRERARGDGHLRIPEALACLYLGCSLGFTFAAHTGAMGGEEAERWRSTAWEELLKLAGEQGKRVEEEKPGRRFLEVLRTLLAQGKAVLFPKSLLNGDRPPLMPGQEHLGWRDEDFAYLIPTAAYHLVARYCRDEGGVFPVKERTLWRELAREKVILHSNGRYQELLWVDGAPRRVLRVPWRCLEPDGNTEGEVRQ